MSPEKKQGTNKLGKGGGWGVLVGRTTKVDKDQGGCNERRDKKIPFVYELTKIHGLILILIVNNMAVEEGSKLQN